MIYGIKPGGRLIDLQPFWQRLRARAGLKDARIHDLRHTFASAAVAAGQGLPMIGKLLGPHAGGDDGALCPSRRRSGEGGDQVRNCPSPRILAQHGAGMPLTTAPAHATIDNRN